MTKRKFLKLRGAVTAGGYQLKDLAEELCITPQALHTKLNGSRDFTFTEVIKTCNWLGCDIDIFFEPELHDLQFTRNNGAM